MGGARSTFPRDPGATRPSITAVLPVLAALARCWMGFGDEPAVTALLLKVPIMSELLAFGMRYMHPSR
jgi:hypothetical protein